MDVLELSKITQPPPPPPPTTLVSRIVHVWNISITCIYIYVVYTEHLEEDYTRKFTAARLQILVYLLPGFKYSAEEDMRNKRAILPPRYLLITSMYRVNVSRQDKRYFNTGSTLLSIWVAYICAKCNSVSVYSSRDARDGDRCNSVERKIRAQHRYRKMLEWVASATR